VISVAESSKGFSANFVKTKIFLKPSGRLVGGLLVNLGREFLLTASAFMKITAGQETPLKER
jgi:hypothetical protein